MTLAFIRYINEPVLLSTYILSIYIYIVCTTSTCRIYDLYVTLHTYQRTRIVAGERDHSALVIEAESLDEVGRYRADVAVRRNGFTQFLP